MGVASWFFKWVGEWDGSSGGVRCIAPQGANGKVHKKLTNVSFGR